MISTATMYASLFLASFLAATVIPLSPDAMAAYLSSRGYNVFLVAATAVFGSYLGSCTTYFLGFYGRKKIIADRVKESKMEKYEAVFKKYGAPALLFSWVPVIGDAIVASAGVLRIDFKIFSAYALIGKAARFAIVSYLASAYIKF